MNYDYKLDLEKAFNAIQIYTRIKLIIIGIVSAALTNKYLSLNHCNIESETSI